MALKKISITKAIEIVDSYGKILSAKEKRWYPNSFLQFYDLINAINIVIAYRYYDYSRKDDPNAYEIVLNWVKGIEQSYLYYPYHFIKDEDFYELNRIDKNSKEYIKMGRKFADIEEAFFHEVHFNCMDSTFNFLDFYKSIGPENKNYWYLVYSKLKVEIDYDDNRLPINKYYNKSFNTNSKFIEKIKLWVYLSLFIYTSVFLYFSKYNYTILKLYLNFTLILVAYYLTKHFLIKDFFERDHSLSKIEKYGALFKTFIYVFGISFFLPALKFGGDSFHIESILKYFTLLILPCILAYFEILKKEQFATEDEKQQIKKDLLMNEKGSNRFSFHLH